MQQAQQGDRARIQYSRVRPCPPAGDVRSAPKVLEFTVGSSDIIPTISFGILGMTPGEQKQFTLQPLESYGGVPDGLAWQNLLPLPRAHSRRSRDKRRSAIHSTLPPLEHLPVVQPEFGTELVNDIPLLAAEQITIEVMLLSLDSSAHANENRHQFDLGGEA